MYLNIRTLSLVKNLNDGIKLSNEGNPIELVNTLHGFPIFVSLLDKEISEHIRNKGTYQIKVLRSLQDFTKAGNVVVHLGVHQGLSDIIIARNIGQNGKIFSFEPNPELYDIAKKNFAINNVDHIIQLNPYGISDTNEQKQLCVDYLNTGAGSFYKNQGDKCFNAELVNLDSFFPDLSNVDLLFMDIEGSEIKALQGAKNLLSRSKSMVIITEWSPEMLAKMGSDAKRFIRSFIEEGRKFYRISNKFQSNRYAEMSEKELLETNQCDIVILPKDFALDENLKKQF